ncbi:hypothetical protein CEXT_413341 [Caerostris extrusa]|nr:hypothetical protein CEXT_413341 [Caerostris extrusa]
MFPCQPTVCMLGHTAKDANVPTVENVLADLGCYKDISVPILEKNLSHVQFAEKPLPISPILEHISKHTPVVSPTCAKDAVRLFALKSYLYKHEESSCMRVHRQQQQEHGNDSNVVLDLATTKDVNGDRNNPSPYLFVSEICHTCGIES